MKSKCAYNVGFTNINLYLINLFIVRINFTPKLPFNKEHLLRHMPVGHLIKFIVTYATPFWRENGLSGEIVSFDDFKISHNHENDDDSSFVGEAPISLVYDATSANGNAALVGFISGVAATRCTHQSVRYFMNC